MLSNIITITRIVFLPIPCYIYIYSSPLNQFICVLIFILLGFTDILDGYIARKVGPTHFGALLDPIADKIFIISICMVLLIIGILQYWLFLLIALREMFITILRSFFLLSNFNIQTDKISKIKTISQMCNLFLITLENIYNSYYIIIILYLFFLIIILCCFLYSSYKYWVDAIIYILWILSIIQILDKEVCIFLQELFIYLFTLISSWVYVSLITQHIQIFRFANSIVLRILWGGGWFLIINSLTKTNIVLIIFVYFLTLFNIGIGYFDNILVKIKQKTLDVFFYIYLIMYISLYFLYN